MRKFYLFLLGMLLSVASIAQLITEPFNYTPDAAATLATQSGGTWVSLNTGDAVLVDNGSLTYTGLPASTGHKVKFDGAGQDYYRAFTSQTTGTIYGSFLMNVTSLGTLGTTGSYFLGFIDGGTTNFGATIWTRASATAGKYNIGIATRTTAGAVAWIATDLDPNTTYYIAYAYVITTGSANDVAKIWLNPTPGSSEPAATATAAAGTDLTSVQRVFIRQEGTATTPFITLDELRVGTTWESVTPSGAATSLATTGLATFGSVCANTTAGPNSFTISGTGLTSSDVTVAALNGFSYSTTSNGTYTSTLTLPQSGGNYSQTVYVKFTPTAVQSYDGNIAVAGGDGTSINVSATGSGVNAAPSPTTGIVSAVTSTTAVAGGSIPVSGCSAVTAYGIEFSTTNNFIPGTGTQVASTNLVSGSFTASLTGLTSNTTYYYRSYATNGGGTGYGNQMSFATVAIDNPTSTTATGVTASSFIANWNAVAGATGYFLDVSTSPTFGNTTNATDLFFSEYVEGSSNNKYVEIYNGTGSDVDLSNYQIQLFANGASVAGSSVTLSGTLANGATVVYKNGSATVYAGAATTNGALNYNGDDAIALYKISTSSFVDIIGNIGEDPGTEWTAAGGYSTLDKTLRRKPTVISGVTTDPSGTGFPTLATEWDVFAIDNVSDLGAHTFNGQTPSFVTGYANLAVTGTSSNVTGLLQGTTYYYRVRATDGTIISTNSNTTQVTTATAAPLPVTFTNIRAAQQGNGIKVSFTNQTETDVVRYEIERSGTGRSFIKVADLAPAHNNGGRADYALTDAAPLAGENIYRVKSIEINGKITYSAIARVNTRNTAAALHLYPNPVKGADLSLQLSSLPAGKYQIRVVNAAGQVLQTRAINHNGGSLSESLGVNGLASGLYSVQVNGPVQLQKSFLVQQ